MVTNMDNTKENDWLSYMMANPNYTIDDFRSNGINAKNTTLGDVKTYENKQVVQNLPQFQTNGKFDKAKFENYYQAASSRYNNLADADFHDDILNFTTFHRDNIYVPASSRREGADTVISEVPNPDRVVTGLFNTDVKEDPTQTHMEIAETQEVWDKKSNSWHAAPNDSFFTDFTDTRAMAQWDSDGTSIDPLTGEKVAHQKGQYKTNRFGYYYTENLNGESPIGREIVSKANTLTTDGSFWNRYDFFDSDDKKKGVVGSLIKSTLPLALLAIPYVNTAYLTYTLSKLALDIGTTVGKCFAGSNNKTLNYLDGFSQSLNPSVSEYSQTHPWSIENVINLAGDTAAMIYTQREVFKKVPKLFGMQDLNSTTKAREVQNVLRKTKTTQYTEDLINQSGGMIKVASEPKKLMSIKFQASNKAAAEVDKVISDYNQVGKAFSQAYMTLLPVTTAYNTAKSEGASDMESSMITLGIAAANALLMTLPVNSWVLPELKMDAASIKTSVVGMVKKDLPVLQQALKEDLTSGVSQKVAKNNFLKNLFTKAKKSATDIYNANYSASKMSLKSFTANSLSASVVNVEFEALHDLSRACVNTVRWFNGDKDTMPVFANMGERYMKAIVGGVLGGGMFQFASDFRTAKALTPEKGEISDQTYNKYKQTLFALMRNGKTKDIYKVIDETPFASKDLTFETTMDADGKISYKPGDETNNQDLTIKTLLKNSLSMYENDLVATGADKTDQDLIDINSLNDLRYSDVATTNAASALLKDFNNVVTRESTLKEQLYAVEHPTIGEKKAAGKTDATVKEPDIYTEDKISAINNKLKYYSDLRQKFTDGSFAKDFLSNAVFELTVGSDRSTGEAFGLVSKEGFILAKSGKDKMIDIPEAELKDLESQYEAYSDAGNTIDLTLANADLYKSTAPKLLETFNYIDKYYKNPDNIKTLNMVNTLADVSKKLEEKSILSGDMDQFGETEKISKDPRYIMSKIFSLSDIDYRNDPDYEPLTKYTENDNIYHDSYSPEALYVFSQDPRFADSISKLSHSYLPRNVKSSISKVIRDMYQIASESGNDVVMDNLLKMDKDIQKAKDPALLNLVNKIGLMSNTKLSVTDILKNLDKQIEAKKNSLGDFYLSEEEATALSKVADLINITKAYVNGAEVEKLHIGRRFNLNETLNKLFGDNSFAEIDSDVAGYIKFGLDNLVTDINYYLKLDAINNSASLKICDRTAVRKDTLLYEKFDKLQKIIPSSWEGASEFTTAIGGLTKLKEIYEAYAKGATADFNSTDLLPEVIRMDMAWHDFRAKNADKDLSEIINSKNFNLYESANEALSAESKSMDDRSFVYHLASREALRSDTFYNEYRNILTDNIAPLDPQELGIYLGYAYALNNKVFKNYSDAIVKSIKNDLNDPTFATKRANYEKRGLIDWNHIMDSAATPLYDIVSIEGYPGSGKTSVIATNIYKLLSTYHKELVENTWVVGSSPENSKNLLNSMGNSSNIKTMEREQLMRTLAPGWKEIINEKGEVVLSYDMFTPASNERSIHSTLQLAALEKSKIPTSIFIDENTRYSQLDIDVINRFARENNIPVFTFGDDHQNKLVGRLKMMDGSEYETGISRNNFIPSPKIGVSLRHDNSQVYEGVKVIRDALETILKSDGTTPSKDPDIRLSFYQNAENLYGYKQYSSIDILSEEGKKDIDFIFEHSTDKVGIIVKNDDSPILKYINGIDRYKDRFIKYTGNNAQSSEATYFIIEDSYNEASGDKREFVARFRSLYTAASRIHRGALLITDDPWISSRQDTSTKMVTLDPSEIKSYSNSKAAKLEELFKTNSAPKSEYIKSEKETIAVVKADDESTEGVISLSESPKPAIEQQLFATYGDTYTKTGKEYKNSSNETFTEYLIDGKQNVYVDKNGKIYNSIDEIENLIPVANSSNKTSAIPQIESNIARIFPYGYKSTGRVIISGNKAYTVYRVTNENHRYVYVAENGDVYTHIQKDTGADNYINYEIGIDVDPFSIFSTEDDVKVEISGDSTASQAILTRGSGSSVQELIVRRPYISDTNNPYQTEVFYYKGEGENRVGGKLKNSNKSLVYTDEQGVDHVYAQNLDEFGIKVESPTSLNASTKKSSSQEIYRVIDKDHNVITTDKAKTLVRQGIKLLRDKDLILYSDTTKKDSTVNLMLFDPELLAVQPMRSLARAVSKLFEDSDFRSRLQKLVTDNPNTSKDTIEKVLALLDIANNFTASKNKGVLNQYIYDIINSIEDYVSNNTSFKNSSTNISAPIKPVEDNAIQKNNIPEKSEETQNAENNEAAEVKHSAEATDASQEKTKITTPTSSKGKPVFVEPKETGKIPTTLEEDLTQPNATDNVGSIAVTESLIAPDAAISNVTEPVELKENQVFMHSFNADSIGVSINADGSIKYTNYEFRNDGFNGLRKILGIDFSTLPLNEKLRLYFTLKDIICTTQSKAEIISKIQDIFNTFGVDLSGAYGTFGYKVSSTYEKTMNGKKLSDAHKQFYIDPETELNYNPTQSKDGSVEAEKLGQGLRHNLVFILGSDGHDILEIPIMTATNPDTYCSALITASPKLGSALSEFYSKHLNEGIVSEAGKKFIGELAKKYPDSKEVVEIQSLIDLYTIGGYGMYLFDGKLASWTPMKDLQYLGNVVRNKNLGTNYNQTGFVHTVERKSLLDIVADKRFSVSDLYQATTSTFVGLNQTFKIRPYILVGGASIPKAELKTIYKQQLLDPTLPKRVKLYYVDAPTGSYSDYVDNLIKIFNNDPNISPLGNISTSYRILSVLFNLNTNTRELYSRTLKDITFTNIDSETIDATIAKLGLSKTFETLGITEMTDRAETLSVINDIVHIYNEGNATGKTNLGKIASLLMSENNGIKHYYRNKCQKLLYNLSVTKTDSGVEKNTNNINVITDALTNASVPNIFYYPKYTHGTDKLFAKLDVANYAMNGKLFTLSDVINPNEFLGDFSPIADLVRSKQTLKQGTHNIYTFTDFTKYVINKCSSVDTATKSTRQDSVFTSLCNKALSNVTISDDAINFVKEHYKGVSQEVSDKLTLNEILGTLKSDGHLVLSLDNSTFVFNKTNGFENAEVTKTEKSTIPGVWNVAVSLKDGSNTKFTGTFDTSKNSITLENIPTETPVSNESILPSLQSFVENYKALTGHNLKDGTDKADRIVRRLKDNEALKKLLDSPEEDKSKIVFKAIDDGVNAKNDTNLKDYFDSLRKNKSEKTKASGCLNITINL